MAWALRASCPPQNMARIMLHALLQSFAEQPWLGLEQQQPMAPSVDIHIPATTPSYETGVQPKPHDSTYGTKKIKWRELSITIYQFLRTSIRRLYVREFPGIPSRHPRSRDRIPRGRGTGRVLTLSIKDLAPCSHLQSPIRDDPLWSS